MSTTTKNSKLCFVFGTRPEIIKLAPVIKAARAQNVPYCLIHTGQHYSPEMDAVFFSGLNLPPPDYNLAVGSGSHAAQTAAMLHGIEQKLEVERPDWVIVQGDTNSVLAGALAAAKLCIPVAHVEAGLRSYDRTMPEEVNRVLAGAIATEHFVPTMGARENLLREGVDAESIHVVGNTVVDAVLENRELAAMQACTLSTNRLKKRGYYLVTIHRPENTDSEATLRHIISSLSALANQRELKMVWPLHPRTRAKIEAYALSDALKSINQLVVLDPVDYFEMLQLQEHCLVAITDSGGIQEETCILKVPCVTIRQNTERPESITVGANQLVPVDHEAILAAVERALDSARNWSNPYGDGTASRQIIARLTSREPSGTGS